jgi:uncharacterized protein (TIGR00725 family)
MVFIGVIGEAEASPENAQHAYEVGRLIAERGATLVCGGGDGVMLHACRGAREAGGSTVGILPGFEHREANPHVEWPIVTGMGELRNAIIVRTSHALIAVGGGCGTLVELAFALKQGIPVVGLNTWSITHPVKGKVLRTVGTPGEAVSLVFDALTGQGA